MAWSHPSAFSCPRSVVPGSAFEPESREHVASQRVISRLTAGWPCGKHPSMSRLLACIFDWSHPLPLSRSNVDCEPLKKSWHQITDIECHYRRQQLLPQRAPDAGVIVVTVVREAVSRFLSEFLHSLSGWSRANDGLDSKLLEQHRARIASDYFCNGTIRVPSAPCRHGRSELHRQDLLAELGLDDRSASHPYRRNSTAVDTGIDLTLEEFLVCPDNAALDRQTRMLANAPCMPNDGGDEAYAAFQRELLQSAKQSLQSIPFFAVAEYPDLSEQLFVWTFPGAKFSLPAILPHTQLIDLAAVVSLHHRKLISRMNPLDVELYAFALTEFRDRIRQCATCDQMPE